VESALSALHYFKDTVGWMTGRASSLTKKSVAKGCLLQQVEETQGIVLFFNTTSYSDTGE